MDKDWDCKVFQVEAKIIWNVFKNRKREKRKKLAKHKKNLFWKTNEI